MSKSPRLKPDPTTIYVGRQGARLWHQFRQWCLRRDPPLDASPPRLMRQAVALLARHAGTHLSVIVRQRLPMSACQPPGELGSLVEEPAPAAETEPEPEAQRRRGESP